jgi:hypothetical protein
VLCATFSTCGRDPPLDAAPPLHAASPTTIAPIGTNTPSRVTRDVLAVRSIRMPFSLFHVMGHRPLVSDPIVAGSPVAVNIRLYPILCDDRFTLRAQGAEYLIAAVQQIGSRCQPITGLLNLSNWPEGSRVIVRRADLEMRRRGHARVEDRIRCGKETGIRNLPCHAFAANAYWLELALAAADLLCWSQASCFTTPSPAPNQQPSATRSSTSPHYSSAPPAVDTSNSTPTGPNGPSLQPEDPEPAHPARQPGTSHATTPTNRTSTTPTARFNDTPDQHETSRLAPLYAPQSARNDAYRWELMRSSQPLNPLPARDFDC